jgi:N-acetylglutamate synthase-like GNAT family acetyltransferase
MASYCYGDAESGEMVVLALLPEYEGLGVGKALLREVMEVLRGLGHQRLFLVCTSDPAVRSYGFYLHLGWSSTNQTDKYGDEMLEYVFSATPACGA